MERHPKQPEPPGTEPQQLLKAAALAKILDCGSATIYAMARQGKIPVVVIGKLGKRFIAKDVIDALTRAGPKEVSSRREPR